MTIVAPKRNVGMTVRFSFEDHERFVNAGKEMGYKHFSGFVRHCLGSVVSNNPLRQHHVEQTNTIKALTERIEIKEELLGQHKRWLDEVQDEVREVRATLETVTVNGRKGWVLANRSLWKIIVARITGKQ